MSESAPRKIVSLFSGCGGMDLGFLGGFDFGGRRWGRLPFEIVWANDFNKRACEAYKLNLRHDIHVGPISEAIDLLPRGADIVLGGFPCQDVSVNGLRRAEKGGRTILYKEMIEAIRRVQPAAFVAENVKGLRMARVAEFFEQMIQDFESLPGYEIDHRVYLASDYGVPQARERIFIVGMKGKRFEPPTPSELRMTAQDALRDLENEPENRAIAHIWSKAARSPDQGNRRLKADKPATTIRAEHHGNIQWHYRLNRRISLREAARLQSFPDDFTFPAGMRETERQIGNAVPPVLAWHVARALHEQLDAR